MSVGRLGHGKHAINHRLETIFADEGPNVPLDFPDQS